MTIRFYLSAIFVTTILGIASACGSSGGDGGSSTGGDVCKPGGAACVTFSECCSGTCANQICTTCATDEQACGPGCCTGSFCANGVCGPPCKGPGEACSAARDCCSNVCSGGT